MDIKDARVYYYEVFNGGPYKPTPKGLFGVFENADLKGFNEHRFWEAKEIHDFPDGVTFYVTGEKEQDYIVVRTGWCVVSDKVKKVFEECKVKGVQFLPVHIIHHKTHKEYGPCWAWNVYQEVDGLDWEHTQWLSKKPEKEEYPSLSIVMEALRLDVVKDLDIFRLHIKGTGDVTVYISPRVKECLEKAGATSGFELIPRRAF